MRDDDLRHWEHHPQIRENHDDDHDYDRDAELDLWLGRGIVVMLFFGTWKLLELAYSVAKWVLS